MGKIKEREFVEYDEEAIEDEGFIASEIEVADDSEELLLGEDTFRARRTWRDTEKYREMRELYKIINDELYTGIYEEDINEEYE